MSKLTVVCSDFRRWHRNTLRGFAVIEIAEMKLEIRDVAIHAKGDARWAQLPSKPQIKNGTLIKDADGKIAYSHIMDFTSRAVRDAFSAAVVRAVLEHDPGAFEVLESAS
jgi:hypothetical protein